MAHDIAGVPSPIESTFVRQVLEAAKRLLGKPAQGKQAVSFDVITKVVEKFNTPLASLSDLRTCFIFVLAFAGIMRSHEIINVKRSQISILPDHMSIFCPVRKNDQRRLGHFVSLARSIFSTLVSRLCCLALVLSVRRHHARVTHQIMLFVLSSAGARGAKDSNE